MTSWRLILRRRRDARRSTAQGRRTEEAVRALIDAIDAASASRIAALLGETATLTVDAGAHSVNSSVPPAPGPVATALELLSLLDAFPDWALGPQEVNGTAGIVIRSRGRVVGIISIAMRAGRITQIWAVVNPDKLAHWNRT
jgi:RNA polymerase sigma-70 factor (ECF subfamily)